MAVLVITINDPVFDKKSAEVAHLQRTLQLLANVIGRGQGTVTSGTIIGTNPAGVAKHKSKWGQYPMGLTEVLSIRMQVSLASAPRLPEKGDNHGSDGTQIKYSHHYSRCRLDLDPEWQLYAV